MAFYSFIWICHVYCTLHFAFANVNVAFSVKSNGVVSEISDHFIGITLDTGVLRQWPVSLFRSKQMVTLAQSLSPTYMRLGGTTADYTIYSTKDETKVLDKRQPDFVEIKQKYEFPFKTNVHQHFFSGYTNFTLPVRIWDEVNAFVKKAGWDFIFDLNSLQRFGNKSWDPLNALELMMYTAHKGYKLVGWELGNEPNIYKGHDVVTPQQLSLDYVRLRQILQELFPGVILIGPSVTNLGPQHTTDYYIDFMKSQGPYPAINASTFHHYYGYEGSFKLSDFVNPKVLDNLIPQVKMAIAVTKKYCPGKQVWIGETSSAWGGGKPGYSDRYVAGFMWLDKLGISAKYGIDTVIRQDFYGNNYGLLNDNGIPNPDYWLTLLYKSLVGGRVLNTETKNLETQTSTDEEDLRVYCHCTNTKRSNYTKGSVTYYLMNLNSSTMLINFIAYEGQELHLYLLEPVGYLGLTSRNVSLNGKLLELSSTGELPDLMIPKIVKNPVEIPGYRFAFVIIPSAEPNLC